MMKLVVFHPALTPYRVDLFNKLSLLCELKVVFLQNNNLSQTFDNNQLLKNACFDYEFLTNGFAIGRLYFRSGIFKLLRRYKPDVVISHEYFGVSFQLLFVNLLSINYKHLIWTAENPSIAQSHSKIRNFIKKVFFRFVDGVVCYSEDLFEWYTKFLGYSGKLYLLPNLPDENIFRNDIINATSHAEKFVKKYNLVGKRILLYVGRLSAEKNVESLVQSFAKSSFQRNDCVLIIVGNGILLSSISKLIDELNLSNSIILNGSAFGRDLYSFYRFSELFILPSLFEPYGAVVNEALISGIPVICSDQVGAKILISTSNGEIYSLINQDLTDVLNEWYERIPRVSLPLRENSPSLHPYNLDQIAGNFINALKNMPN